MKLGNSSAKGNWAFFFLMLSWGSGGGRGGGGASIVQLTFHDAGKLNLFPEQSDPISPGWE